MTAFWLIAFIAFVAGEAATVGLVCIWFAAGAVGGFLVAVLGGQFWFQLIVFAAVSALTLALVRPAAARFAVFGRLSSAVLPKKADKKTPTSRS